MTEIDKMVCRACGKDERASEGYPCQRCGTFICVICNMRGVTMCKACQEKGSVTPSFPPSPPAVGT